MFQFQSTYIDGKVLQGFPDSGFPDPGFPDSDIPDFRTLLLSKCFNSNFPFWMDFRHFKPL